jgi:ectoine hydroxylase-related dioxygenase (phytanoyl-CoA dioxygenase family)
MGVQLFLMVYLVDTTPHNGCLRVLPGSHLQKIPLDDELGMEDPHAHGGRSNWSEEWARDPSLDEKVQDMVSTYPGAVDVAVRAGDLIIGDSRLYHAAYRNASHDVRT